MNWSAARTEPLCWAAIRIHGATKRNVIAKKRMEGLPIVRVARGLVRIFCRRLRWCSGREIMQTKMVRSGRNVTDDVQRSLFGSYRRGGVGLGREADSALRAEEFEGLIAIQVLGDGGAIDDVAVDHRGWREEAMRRHHVVDGTLVADLMPGVRMFGPCGNPQRQAIGLANPEVSLQGAVGDLAAVKFKLAAFGGLLLPSNHRGSVDTDLGLSADLQIHLLDAALREGEQKEGIIGRDVDEAVLGEVFEHALAEAVVCGVHAKG